MYVTFCNKYGDINNKKRIILLHCIQHSLPAQHTHYDYCMHNKFSYLYKNSLSKIILFVLLIIVMRDINPLSAVGAYRCLAKAIGVD